MRVLLVTGIWPPDVGGPATHGPELARFLVERGHEVRGVTMADDDVTEQPCAVVTVPRSLPFPARYGLVAARAAAEARRADVVYASATYAAAAAAATAARRPLVAKLVSDPAYERARRWGLFRGTLEAFQAAEAPRLRALKALRTVALSRASAVIVPSEYLAGFARSWRLDAQRISVVPNPVPLDAPPPAERAGETFVFAGRLTEQKALDVALDAVARLDRGRLVIVGDGPERGRLERRASDLGLNGRVEFRGARPREEVLAVLTGATAAVLTSAWENLPHAAVEALAAGTPVVATAVGGVPEVVRDGENGLLVAAGEPEAVAAALARLLDDAALWKRLAAGARASAEALDPVRAYGAIERVLAEAAT